MVARPSAVKSRSFSVHCFCSFFHIANSDREVAQDLLLNAFPGAASCFNIIKTSKYDGQVQQNGSCGCHPPLANRIFKFFQYFNEHFCIMTLFLTCFHLVDGKNQHFKHISNENFRSDGDAHRLRKTVHNWTGKVTLESVLIIKTVLFFREIMKDSRNKSAERRKQ